VSKYLLLRIEKCAGAAGFWLLIAACFRHVKYLLLRDVSCQEELVDDITQVVSYDFRNVRVEFAPYPIIHRCSFPSTRMYALVFLSLVKWRLEHSPKRSLQIATGYFLQFFHAVFVAPIAVFYLDAGLLARSQYTESPATGHFDAWISSFPCV